MDRKEHEAFEAAEREIKRVVREVSERVQGSWSADVRVRNCSPQVKQEWRAENDEVRQLAAVVARTAQERRPLIGDEVVATAELLRESWTHRASLGDQCIERHDHHLSLRDTHGTEGGAETFAAVREVARRADSAQRAALDIQKLLLDQLHNLHLLQDGAAQVEDLQVEERRRAARVAIGEISDGESQ